MKRFVQSLVVVLVLAPPPAFPAAGLTPAPCPDGVDATAVTCGTFSVPEDYAAEAGRQIELYVVVIPPAVKPMPDAVPLVMLAGGPGNSIADTAGWYLDDGGIGYAFRRDRPLILLDQRGTGQSNPLHCLPIESRTALDRFYPTEQVRTCREALAATNDLAQFGTGNAARDLDRVRAALGHDRLDLWAISYGTILAQAYLTAYPLHVRRAVLAGAVPLDALSPLYHAASAQRVLDLLFFECRSDPRCSAAYPALRDDWQKLLARIDRDPPAVVLKDDEGKETWSGPLQRDVFAEAFRSLLSSAGSLRRVPWIIHEAAAGNLSPLLESFAGPDVYFSAGLYLSVTCAEATLRIRSDDVEPAVAGTFLGDYRVRQQRAACEEWPQRQVPESFFEPLESDVPVLLLVGDLDYVTPPAWSYRIARGLSRSRVVTMPHGGHLFWDWGEDEESGACFDRLALAFYESGELRNLDASCAQDVAPPAFLLPE
jgi:pimeloyl-ACP methyl ester carboxylesterase